MGLKSKEIAINFIKEIWNQNQFDKLENYIHPKFTDHSLPSDLPTNIKGLKLWIIGTGYSFKHKTIIEEIVSEDNKVMLKIKILLKHIGKWRDIEPTGVEIFTVGYRYLKFADDRIIEHWALIDGNAIEKQLKEATHGCKNQE